MLIYRDVLRVIALNQDAEIVENRFLHIAEFSFDLDQRSGALLDGGVRVVQTVAGKREDYANALNGGQRSPFRNN